MTDDQLSAIDSDQRGGGDRNPAQRTVLKVVDTVLISNLWLRTIIALALAAALIIFAEYKQVDRINPPIYAVLSDQIGIAILVAAVGAGLVQLFIMAAPRAKMQITEDLALAGRLQREAAQAEQFHSITQSLGQVHGLLEVLDRRTVLADQVSRTGALKVYVSQVDSYTDMIGALHADSLSDIRLMGLSLRNWFGSRTAAGMRTPGAVLEGLFEGGLRSQPTGAAPINVRALLVDPYSMAAHLLTNAASEQESRENLQRLRNEVRLQTTHLSNLRDRLRRSFPQHSLEVRLYRALPGSFQFSYDTGSFVRPYHAGPPYGPDAPVLLYGTGSSVHAASRVHFDKIWEHCSIAPSEVLDEKSFGVDQGIAQNGICNVYSDEIRARERMTWLIEHARHRVWIQGISLGPMFIPPIEQAMFNLSRKTSIDTRLLALDPECEQAYIKTYRDHLIDAGRDGDELAFGDYKSRSDRHRRSPLYTSIRHSTQRISQMNSGTGAGHMHLRYYMSAPSSFVLIADDRVLIEQYHYGKLERAIQGQLLLTKEMPLIEYEKPHEDLFGSAPGQDPFKVIEDSFLQVYEHFSRPPEGASR